MSPRKRKTGAELPQRVYLRHGAYYYVHREGQRWERLGTTLREVYAWLATYDGPRPKDEVRTVAELLAKWLGMIEPDMSPETMRTYRGCVDRLMPVWGHVRLSDVHTADLYDYYQRRSAKAAALKEIRVLGTAFTYAVRWRWADVNPVQAFRLSRSERPRPRSKARGAALWEGLQAIRKAAPGWLAVMMDLSLATGLRRTDVVKIRLSDITPEGLKVITSKTKAPLVFSLTLGLRAILEAARGLPGRRTSVYLFADRQGQPYDPQDVSLAFRRITERLKVSGVTFHSCRAWAITQAEQARGLKGAQTFAGHSQIAQTERYLRGDYVPVDPLDIGRVG